MDKINKAFGFFSEIFRDIGGNSKDFIPIVKLLMYNKLTHLVSIHQLLKTYPKEVLEQLGMRGKISERTIYRALEKVGRISQRYFSTVLIITPYLTISFITYHSLLSFLR